MWASYLLMIFLGPAILMAFLRPMLRLVFWGLLHV
jgi:hypothetical protein